MWQHCLLCSIYLLPVYPVCAISIANVIATIPPVMPASGFMNLERRIGLCCQTGEMNFSVFHNSVISTLPRYIPDKFHFHW